MTEQSPLRELKMLPLNILKVNKYQPRHNPKDKTLQSLADTIKTTRGLLQPLLVRKINGGAQFEIVSGERRWHAAKLAGLDKVQCMVATLSDEQSLQAAIIENIARLDLNPIEEGMAYQRLLDKFDYNHSEIAEKTGKSRTYITNLMRLLRLEDQVKNLLEDRLLSEGHGKLLIGLAPEVQMHLAEQSVEKGWSVRQLEQVIQRLEERKASRDKPLLNPNLQNLESSLQGFLGCSVKISTNRKGGGFLKLPFKTLKELKTHCYRLGLEEPEVFS